MLAQQSLSATYAVNKPMRAFEHVDGTLHLCVIKPGTELHVETLDDDRPGALVSVHHADHVDYYDVTPEELFSKADPK